MVCDHLRYVYLYMSRLVLVRSYCKQLSLEIASAWWIALFSCCSWIFLKFAGPLFKMFFFWTILSEAKCLTIRNWAFAVMWMAAIHADVLMCVCGLDMQDKSARIPLVVTYHPISPSFHSFTKRHHAGQYTCVQESILKLSYRDISTAPKWSAPK